MRPKLKSKADQSSDWRRPSSDNNNIVISSNTASTPVDSTNTMLSIHNTLSNNFKVIDKQILHLYNSTQPSNTIRSARSSLIKRVSDCISSKYGKSYTVEAFGSTCYDVSSSSSDLDLIMVDQLRPDGFDPSVNMYDLPVAYNPNNVAKTLMANGFKNVQPIFAAVPIVKFTDPQTKLQCDLNANNLFGIRNSLLIKSYLDLSPIARPLVLAIKLWAKRRGLNDSSGQNGPTTLSSYSIILMLLCFFQIVGHSPNLQDHLQIKAAGLPERRLWVRPPVKRRDMLKETRFKVKSESNVNSKKHDFPSTPITSQPNVRVSFDTAFISKPLNDFTPVPLTLSNALTGFFYFYAGCNAPQFDSFWNILEPFHYETQIASLKYGGLLPRDDPFHNPYQNIEDGHNSDNSHHSNHSPNAQQPLQWREQLIITQDPFITTRNTCTNVKAQTTRCIIEEFRRAHELINTGANLDQICQKRSYPLQGDPGPASFRMKYSKSVIKPKRYNSNNNNDNNDNKNNESNNGIKKSENKQIQQKRASLSTRKARKKIKEKKMSNNQVIKDNENKSIKSTSDNKSESENKGKLSVTVNINKDVDVKKKTRRRKPRSSKKNTNNISNNNSNDNGNKK